MKPHAQSQPLTPVEAQRQALEQILATTLELRTALESNQDVAELLERRESQCRAFGDLCSDQAHSAAALDPSIETLAQRITACQSECESIMRSKLE